jgi:hypothetical protein
MKVKQLRKLLRKAKKGQTVRFEFSNIGGGWSIESVEQEGGFVVCKAPYHDLQ